MPQSWQDQALNLLIFHREMIRLYGLSNGRPRNGTLPGWSIRKTATEKGISTGRCCEDLAIGRGIEEDEGLRLCPTREEALRRVKRRREELRVKPE